MPFYVFKPFSTDYARCRVIKTTVRCHPDLTPRFAVRDGTYFTVFGPLFYNKDLNFPGAGCDEVRGSLTSMLQVRNSDVLGYHDTLFDNQIKTIRKLRAPLHNYFMFLKANFVCSDFDDEFTTWICQQHPKRKLRLAVHDEYVNRLFTMKDGCVNFKMKNGEYLPVGKKRGICDIGALRTNLTGYIIDALKTAMSRVYMKNGVEYRFVKTADRSDVTCLFKEVIHCNHSVFAFHGDDSIGGFECLDGRILFNADISKCDGSHGAAMIYKLKSLLLRILAGTGHSDYVEYAFQLLEQDLVYKNPSNNREYIKYHFTQPRLYSGSVLTTIMNSFANLCIGLYVSTKPKVMKNDFKRHFEQCAADLGYIVKVQICDKYQNLQFLKMSPFYNAQQQIVAVNNLGSWFKSFGIFPGDLPGRGQLIDKARKHNFEVVIGRVDWGNHRIAQAFGRCVQRMTRVLHGADMFEHIDITNENLCHRYGCTNDEIECLAKSIELAGIGSIVNDPLVNLFYDIDYG